MRTLSLVVGVAACGLGLGACDGDDPEPQKLERLTPFDRGGNKRAARDPDKPLRNPGLEAPRGRDGDQVPEAERVAALAKAKEEGEVGNRAGQRNALRVCANKTPADARCDGEMGLAQIEAKNRKATALYYLVEAANNDDPSADAELYERVGVALRGHGKHPEAAAALRLAIARQEVPNPELLFELGRTLSLDSSQLAGAVEFMARARAVDPRLDWIYEEAVLRGQMGVREDAEEAARLFRQYLELAKASGKAPNELPAMAEAVEARATELEQVAKTYPTREQAGVKQAEPMLGAPPEAAKPDEAKPDEAKPESPPS